jgi:hypothetical protein
MGMLTKRNRSAVLTLLAPVISPFQLKRRAARDHCGIFKGTGPSRGRVHLRSADRYELWRHPSCPREWVKQCRSTILESSFQRDFYRASHAVYRTRR